MKKIGRKKTRQEVAQVRGHDLAELVLVGEHRAQHEGPENGEDADQARGHGAQRTAMP